MRAPPEHPKYPLQPHPASPQVGIQDFTVSCAREGGILLLHYRLSGDLGDLKFPVPAPVMHTDGLWHHTCFEAFVGRRSSTAYCEYNFSPSGAWAMYQFSGYRAGGQPHRQGAAPDFRVRRDSGILHVDAEVDVGWLSSSEGGAARLGVTAVIEDVRGGLSYWALEHP